VTAVAFLMVFAAALLIVAGVVLALCWQRREFARLSEVRQQVRGELVAMEQTRRIHDAYFDARAAMRRPERPTRLHSDRLA
jgi:hypothetical protein